MPDPTQPAIVTPCHATPLFITLRFQGHGYLSREVVDTSECQYPGCSNTWDSTGNPT